MDNMEKLNDNFMSEILGLENEYDILNKQAKTPEEIEKWCTKEDLPEVKRLVSLMKKGYEVQKISVVNNLDRYMQEAGANEELFSLIVDSLMDWDDKMQKECAYSFIKPLEMDLINKRNKEKVIKVAIQITTDDDNAENTELIDSWIKVLETVVSRVDMKYVTENVIKVIKDIPGLKNPQPKRKRGNRLVFAVAKHLGEEKFDKDPQIMQLILSICHDTNYKMRRDGVIFLKEYFQYDRDRILAHERFQDIYLPELVDFLNDEDLHIQIDAIEAVNEILEELDEDQIENDFIPCFLNFLDTENQSQIEIIRRIAQIFGQVLYKLKKVNKHLKYKEQAIQFFKEISLHEDEQLRKWAVFNLPCMNLLFKSVENELHISFQQLWQKFIDDESYDIKKCAASSLHEAFKIIDKDEDITDLRKAFISLITDDNRDIQLLMNQNLDIMIEKYGNEHTIKNFKGRTPYNAGESDSGDDQIKESTPTSNSNKAKSSKAVDDFSAAFLHTHKNKLVKKTVTSYAVDQTDDDSQKLPPIYTTEEYDCELVYSDLLQRLMVLINNIRGYSGLWREHSKLINHLVKTIHLFYMPEIHQVIVPMLIEFIHKGNKETKEASCHCLSIILQYQHHGPSREQLLEMVKKELIQSNNWVLRKTFIYFCKYSVRYVPCEFFKKHFMKDYISCSQDKVPHVRMEFAKAMLSIKPYFDKDVDLSLELMDVLNALQSDADRDVLEAVEHTDYELLQARKKSKGVTDEKADLAKVEFQKKLVIREKIEIEERKKRVDDDEESKYDMANFLEQKKWRTKATKFSHLNRRPTGGISKNTNSGTMKTPVGKINSSDNVNEQQKIKKQKTIKPKASNSIANESDFQKSRKNSIIIGGSKDDQIKRYHAMVSGQNGQSTNGSTTRTNQSSTNNIKSSGTKPRRHTVMNVNLNSNGFHL